MKKILLISLLIVLMVGTYFFCFGDAPVSESAVPDRKVEKPATMAPQLPEKNLPVQAALIPEDLALCGLFFREIEMLQQQFFWSLGDERFYALIEKGYSLDDVTQVIEQLDTAGSAMKFRLKYMARFAPSVKYLSPERGISDTKGSLRRFPPKWFSRAVSKGNPITVPAGEEVLPEDIAWMLRNADISDDDVLQAAALLPDISARLYVDNFVWFDLVSPLEIAAEKGRGELALNLLKYGARPRNDAYLGSTLDRALDGLEKLIEDAANAENNALEKIRSQVLLVETLQAMGQKAGLVIHSDGGVNSRPPINGYGFSAKLVEQLQQNVGLDLSAISVSEPLSPGRSEELLAQLGKLRAEFLAQKGVAAQKDNAEMCLELSKSVDKKLDIELVPGSELVGKSDAELHNIAPEFVSCKRRALLNQRYRAAVSKEGRIPGLFDELRNNAVSSTSWELISQRSELARSQIYLHSIRYNLEAHQAFFDAGLVPETLDYSSHSGRNFSVLAEEGFDIYQLDVYGRSLLFPAIRTWQEEDFAFLVEQEVPYYTQDAGPDPLYMVLFQMAVEDERASYDRFVSLVMSYEPDVTDEHLKLMQLLKLKAPDAYRHIADDYPQLEVEGEPFPYPTQRCTVRASFDPLSL